MKNICCFYGPVILLQHFHERRRSKYPLSFALRNMIWFVHPNLETDDVGYDTHTNLIRDQYSSPKKNTQTLASASFPRFCWPFFLASLMAAGLFFWFLRRTVLRMQGVIHLADAQSDARFHAGGFSRGNSQANSGVGAKAGLAIRGRGLDAGGVIIYRFHWKRCGCF